MQKTNKIMIKAALAIITAVLTTGCISEKMDDPGNLQNVLIEIDVRSDAVQTKASPTETEKVINSYRIYAFQGTRICGYHHQSGISSEPVLMDLEIPDGESSIDFFIVANEDEMGFENGKVTMSETMTREEIESIRFTSLITRMSLPMYCKQTEILNTADVTANPDAPADHLGHFLLNKKVVFKLQRSLAKISVFAAKSKGSAVNPQILEVNLLPSGTRHFSYLFPQSDEVLDAVVSRANERVLLTSAVSVTKEVERGENDSDAFDPVVADVYLPEVNAGSARWDEPSSSDRAAILSVKYNLGEGQPYKVRYVHLPEIVRNTHYKVCILINAEGQIIINYSVAKWEDHKMENITFDYPTHSYIRENVPLTESSQTRKPSAPAQMSESSPFKGYFQMTYPESDSWTPSLLGDKASECNVKVYEYQSSEEASFPVPASDKWYVIEVSKKVGGNMQAGDEVRLAVTYTPDGSDFIEYLLVNGSGQEYYWPYSGASDQDADYVIITMVN